MEPRMGLEHFTCVQCHGINEHRRGCTVGYARPAVEQPSTPSPTKTSDAVAILHKRYIKDDSARLQSLKEERDSTGAWPRRNSVDKWTPAEKAIQDAVDAVEVTGCDARLTDAVILLQQAREKVSDFVDDVAIPAQTEANVSRNRSLE